jgi:hypothetical protein
LNNWPNQPYPPRSSNGTDFIKNLREQVNNENYPVDVFDKNNIIIGIWNLAWQTVLTDSNDSLANQIKWIESELLTQTKKLYNKFPHLNYRENLGIDSNYAKPRIAKTPDQLFTFL